MQYESGFNYSNVIHDFIKADVYKSNIQFYYFEHDDPSTPFTATTDPSGATASGSIRASFERLPDIHNAKVGDVLTVQIVKKHGNNPTAYQWTRKKKGSSNSFSSISGQTTDTLSITLTADDIEADFSCKMTGSGLIYSIPFHVYGD